MSKRKEEMRGLLSLSNPGSDKKMPLPSFSVHFHRTLMNISQFLHLENNLLNFIENEIENKIK